MIATLEGLLVAISFSLVIASNQGPDVPLIAQIDFRICCLPYKDAFPWPS
jgi:hypothetical protein